MRRLFDIETVPGLLALGALVGVLLLPLLWMARLGVTALHTRATARVTARAAEPAASDTSTPEPIATPAPAIPAPSASASREATDLPALALPVRGMQRKAITGTFGERRGSRRHEGLDIRAPRGTPVLAASDGRIARLSRSGPGGIELYQLDGDLFCLYYAHLLRYAAGLREGQRVKRGQIIGYVGTSGNAQSRAPHLHFGVMRAETPGRCEGEALDPLPLFR